MGARLSLAEGQGRGRRARLSLGWGWGESGNRSTGMAHGGPPGCRDVWEEA